MRTLDLYIIRKFLSTFFFSILMLTLIIIIFDLSERVDDFIDKQAPLRAIIFDYYLNFLPFLINNFSALFTFISVVFFTSRLAMNTEIIAILSAGISFWRLMRPYLISASVIMVLSMILSAYVIPVSNRSLFAFEQAYLRSPRRTQDINIHMQLHPGVFVYVERFNTFVATGFQFELKKIGPQGITYKLSADRIVYDSITGRWRIENYLIREIDSLGERLTRGDILDTTFSLLPSDFRIDTDRDKILTTPELTNEIKIERIRGSGRVIEYAVEKQSRIAFPVANIILTLIGVAVSARKVRGGIGFHLGFGLTITFSFVLFMQVSRVFGMYGDLPPLVAVWLPNLFFGIMAAYLIYKAPK